VGYDIRDPQRLRRVSTLLKGYGERVQYSVFRCRLSDMQKERMLWELARLMWPEDSLVVVPLCRGCYGRIEIKGSAEWTDDPNLVVL
jgi:CRISPR-associated protein Cas2